MVVLANNLLRQEFFQDQESPVSSIHISTVELILNFKSREV
jgi:hypothetical protein